MKRHGYTNITGDVNYDGLEPRHYKSQLERDAFMYWMMEPGVSKVLIEPPPKKKYMLDGKEHDYTPDLFVAFAPNSGRGPFYIECKYTDQLDDVTKRKHEAIRAMMAAEGRIFVVKSEKDVYDETFPSRRFLLFARDEPRDKEMEAEILAELSKTGEAEVGCLLKHLRKTERLQLELVPQVWRLAGLHQISIRLTSLLTAQTLVGPIACSCLSSHGV